MLSTYSKQKIKQKTSLKTKTTTTNTTAKIQTKKTTNTKPKTKLIKSKNNSFGQTIQPIIKLETNDIFI